MSFGIPGTMRRSFDVSDFDTLVEQAQQLLDEQNFSESAAVYERALALNPDDADAHEALATVCFMLSDFERASQHFEEVTRLDPSRDSAFVNWGAVLNRAGRYDKAITVLRKAIQLRQSSAEGYYNLGIAHRHLQQFPLAIPAYREAIRLNPQMVEAHQNLGNVYLDAGNLIQAETSFKKALEIDPQFERARRGLDKTLALMAEQRKSASPFGRLVTIEQLDEAAVTHPAARLTGQESPITSEPSPAAGSPKATVVTIVAAAEESLHDAEVEPVVPVAPVEPTPLAAAIGGVDEGAVEELAATMRVAETASTDLVKKEDLVKTGPPETCEAVAPARPTRKASHAERTCSTASTGTPRSDLDASPQTGKPAASRGASATDRARRRMLLARALDVAGDVRGLLALIQPELQESLSALKAALASAADPHMPLDEAIDDFQFIATRVLAGAQRLRETLDGFDD